MDQINNIVVELKNAKSVLICIHESPDGDAIGSMLALGKALKDMKKDTTMYCVDPVPIKHRFLSGWETVTSDAKILEGRTFDIFVMLDCGDRNRCGKYITNFSGYKKLINIDHHVSNPMFGDLNYVNSKASCTGEEVYEVIKELLEGKKLDKDIATALLTALYDDTGGMRYISTTAHTLRIAAELVESGANCAHVSENLFFSVSREKMQLTSKVLSTLNFELNGKVAYMIMKLSDLDITKAKTEDSEGLIDFPRSIEGVELAFIVKEVAKDKYKFSFRSRGKVDVNQFCSNYGGGGHKVAAGCTIQGDLAVILDSLLKELQKLLS